MKTEAVFSWQLGVKWTAPLTLSSLILIFVSLTLAVILSIAAVLTDISPVIVMMAVMMAPLAVGVLLFALQSPRNAFLVAITALPLVDGYLSLAPAHLLFIYSFLKSTN